MILILIFAEVLGEFHPQPSVLCQVANGHRPAGLYGLIVALLMNSRGSIDVRC
jgi:hypothetical protein